MTKFSKLRHSVLTYKYGDQTERKPVQLLLSSATANSRPSAIASSAQIESLSPILNSTGYLHHSTNRQPLEMCIAIMAKEDCSSNSKPFYFKLRPRELCGFDGIAWYCPNFSFKMTHGPPDGSYDVEDGERCEQCSALSVDDIMEDVVSRSLLLWKGTIVLTWCLIDGISHADPVRGNHGYNRSPVCGWVRSLG